MRQPCSVLCVGERIDPIWWLISTPAVTASGPATICAHTYVELNCKGFVRSPMNVSAESRDMSCVVHCDVGPVTVRLGAGSVEVDPNFRLYMVTRLANPTYLPEASTMVNVVNFTITRQVRLHLPSASSPISPNQRQSSKPSLPFRPEQCVWMGFASVRVSCWNVGNFVHPVTCSCDNEALPRALSSSRMVCLATHMLACCVLIL